MKLEYALELTRQIFNTAVIGIVKIGSGENKDDYTVSIEDSGIDAESMAKIMALPLPAGVTLSLSNGELYYCGGLRRRSPE